MLFRNVALLNAASAADWQLERLRSSMSMVNFVPIQSEKLLISFGFSIEAANEQNEGN